MDRLQSIVEKSRFELVFELSEIEIDALKTLLNNIKEIRGPYPDMDISVRVRYN